MDIVISNQVTTNKSTAITDPKRLKNNLAFIDELPIPVSLTDDFIFADKPYGISTHSPDVGKIGFVELLQQQLIQLGAIDRPLFVAHRLDKTTTGAMIFARTKESAEFLRVAFEKHQVQKTYQFVTDRKSAESSYQVRSKIPDEAETHFTRIKRSPFFELWQATPLTGKKHQIRIHAQELGLSILGDPTYGGTPFPHLCLHSVSLKMENHFEWVTNTPRFFERLGLLKDKKLIGILSQMDRRQRLFDFLKNKNEVLHLYLGADYQINKMGSHFWINRYLDSAVSESEILRFKFVSQLLSMSASIQQMQNRGKDAQLKQVTEVNPERPTVSTWQAKENGITYELRSEQGLSCGLFLDQRQNRLFVKRNSQEKRVLNLFSYTGGFSLNAAIGGAKEVISVDLYPKYLQWTKRNFELNGFDLSIDAKLSDIKNTPKTKLSFFAIDSFDFLERAVKRSEKFDLIICDPPSFSRNKDKVFRIEKDIVELLSLCKSVLASNGKLLFSTNYTEWTSKILLEKIEDVFPKAKYKVDQMPNALDQQWDYEKSDSLKINAEHSRIAAEMKAFLVSNK